MQKDILRTVNEEPIYCEHCLDTSEFIEYGEKCGDGIACGYCSDCAFANDWIDGPEQSLDQKENHWLMIHYYYDKLIGWIEDYSKEYGHETGLPCCINGWHNWDELRPSFQDALKIQKKIDGYRGYTEC